MTARERRPLGAPSTSTAKTTDSTVASDADSRHGQKADHAAGAGRTARPSIESQFLDFVAVTVAVFLAPDGQVYGARHSMPHWAATVRALVDELAQEFYAANLAYPPAKARAAVVDFLRGRATLQPSRAVYLRSAWLSEPGVVLIDTGHGDEVVTVSSHGWTRRTAEVPVAFRRTPTMAPLVIHESDVPRAEGLRLLRELVPVSDRDIPVLLALLLTSLLTNIPQPIVLVTGPRDSGKTSTARFLLSLVDPATHLRGGGLPVNEGAWKAAANTARVQLLDNLGHITPAQSDLLCRVASGGEVTTRALYTDDTAHVTSLQVPVWLTTVDPGVLREDLASRMVLLPLQALTRETRLAESELRRRQDAARPRLTRFLLDLLADVLREMPRQRDAALTHRMGDFELVLRCVDRLLSSEGAARLAEHSFELAADVLDSDPVAQCLLLFAASEVAEAGQVVEVTPTELLKELTLLAGDDARARSWPRTPGVLTSHLNRISPTLEEAQGVRLTTGLRVGKKRDRRTRIERVRADTHG